MIAVGQREQTTRPFPVVGVLALFAGGALLFVTNSLPHVAEAFGGRGRLVWRVLALMLSLWGLMQIVLPRRGRLRFGWLNRLSPHRMSATREGLVYVAIMSVMFIGSVLGRSNMLMLVFAMMIGPWVINGWVAFSMLRRMRVTRRLPHRAVAGVPTSVEVEVRNGKWLIGSWLLAARDHIVQADESTDVTTLFVRIPARQSRLGHYSVTFSRRGEYAFGPIRLTTNFPLGLIERAFICDAPARLVVHPRIGRLTSRWQRDVWDATEMTEQRVSRSGLFDDEFQRIREFRPGDSPRAIHWRTTARQGTLMVREFDSSRDHDLRLIVELWLPAHPSAADRDRLELAVCFAATVAHDRFRQSQEPRLSVVICGHETFRWDQRSSGEKLFDHLAVAQGGAAADLPQILSDSHQSASRGRRTVIVTSRQRKDFGSRFRVAGERSNVVCLSSEPEDLSTYFLLPATSCDVLVRPEAANHDADRAEVPR